MNWWEFPEEEKAIAQATPSPLAKPRSEVIRELEEEINAEAATVLRGAMRFADIDPNLEEPPEEWILELGQMEAAKQFRMAKYALTNAKEAPIGLRIAKDLLVGFAKSRAKEKAPAKSLQMIVVNMTGPLPRFEELEVDK